MALYKCECGKQEKYIGKSTIILVDNKWVTKEAKCECGLYMDSEPAEGMPSLIRTEDSLNRNRKWSETKEIVTGERGINDDFK